MKIKDHLGNEFSTKADMCSHYNIGANTFDGRIRRGLSLKEALETPIKTYSRAIAVKDHLGNTFQSIKEMCKHWGIREQSYRFRIKCGWSLKDTLETPINKNKRRKKTSVNIIEDHLGNVFDSVLSMCKHWGITLSTYYRRRKAGWSMKDALETQIEGSKRGKSVKDHLGNSYISVKAMSSHYGISHHAFNTRIKLGWSLRDALETPVSTKARPKKCVDHLRNEFESISAMCRYWNISYTTYKHRLKMGWSLVDILETPEYNADENKLCTDHLGNTFKSIGDMCTNWGIDLNTYNHRLSMGWSLRDILETPF